MTRTRYKHHSSLLFLFAVSVFCLTAPKRLAPPSRLQPDAVKGWRRYDRNASTILWSVIKL